MDIIKEMDEKGFWMVHGDQGTKEGEIKKHGEHIDLAFRNAQRQGVKFRNIGPSVGSAADSTPMSGGGY